MAEENTIKEANGDRRSIGNSNQLVPTITTQLAFDDQFDLLFHKERTVAMRAADTIEKVTKNKPQFLRSHKNALVSLLLNADNIELKWHLALMIPRLNLTKTELKQCWERLKTWALDPNESRIVRVNAIQALFDLLPKHNRLAPAELLLVIETVSKENIPSVKARLKRLSNAIKELND